MALDKIAAFYDDPVKKQCDAWSMAKSLQFPLAVDREEVFTGGRSAGRGFSRWLGEGLLRRMRHRFNAPPAHSNSILVVIIVVAVVVGLIAAAMRLEALIVPQLAIHAIGREQLGMRAALDRLAA